MNKVKKLTVALLVLVIGLFAGFTLVGCGEDAPTVTDLTNKATLTVADVTYGQTPTGVVRYKDKTLVEGTDYTIEFGDYSAVNAEITATVTFKGKYKGSVTDTYAVTAYDASGATVTISDVEIGETPVATVALDGFTLTADDYEVNYGDYSAVAESVTATVTFKGNFTGTATATYAVTVVNVSGAEVSLANADAIVYDGTAKTPAVVVKKGEKTFTLDTDYTLAYENNVNAGQATVTVTFKGDYAGTATGSFTIAPKAMTGGIQAIASVTYNGQAQKPEVSIVDGETALVEGTDYVVNFINNVNAGTATAVAEFMGNYSGMATATFTIDKFDIKNAVVTVEEGIHNGFAVTPAASLEAHGEVLDVTTLGFDIQYANNVAITTAGEVDGTHVDDYGVGTVTLTAGDGSNYTGSVSKEFKFYNQAIHKTIDSDDSDWADYTGNEAVIYSVLEKDVKQLHVVNKMWAGSDGLYSFTEAKHGKSEAPSSKPWQYGAIVFELRIARKDEAKIKDINGTERFHVTLENIILQKDTASYLDRGNVYSYVQTGEDGNYTTKIEGFFSYAFIKSLVRTSLHNPDDFFTEEGYLKDEYDFRLLTHWDNQCETFKMYEDTLYKNNVHTGATSQTSAPQRHAWAGEGTNDNLIRLAWYVDAWNAPINNGLRSSRYVAQEKAIDGDVSDWASFDEALEDGVIEVGKYELTAYDAEGKQNRNATIRGYYGSDGLYVSVDMLTNELIYGNVANGSKPSYNMFVNTHIEIAFYREAVKNTNVSFTHKQLAINYGVNMSEAMGVGFYPEQGMVESCWTYEINEDGQYHSQVEVFVPNAVLDYIKEEYEKKVAANKEALDAVGYVPYEDIRISTFLIGNYLSGNDFDKNTSTTTYGYAGENFGGANTVGGKGQAFSGLRPQGVKGENFAEWSSLPGYVAKPIDLTNKATFTVADVVYGQTPTEVVTYKDKTLVKDVDYTIELGDYSAVKAEITATVNFIGKYTGSITDTYAVTAYDASGATFTIADVNVGETPVAVVALDGFTFVENVDYTVDYGDYSVGAFSVTATLIFKGNYSGTLTTTYAVKATEVGDVQITFANADTIVYDGTAKTPEVIVKNGDETLTAGTDYTVAYENNVNAGQAKLIVTFKGVYTGSATGAFTIVPKAMTDGIQAIASVTYNGQAQEPEVSVVDGAKVLAEETDYTVSYANNVNAGTANVTVEFKGNYEGTATATFTIDKFDIKNAILTVEDGKHNGFAVTPATSLEAHGEKLDVTALGITTAYANNVAITTAGEVDGTHVDDYGVGTVTLTAPADGNYTGNVSKEFKFYNQAVHKVIDSDDSDWADYTGNEAVIYSVKEGDNKQVEVVNKMWAGSDGLYSFTEAKHGKSEKGSDKWAYSAIVFELRIARKDEAKILGANGYYRYEVHMTNIVLGKDIVQSSAVDYSYVQTGEEGNLTTKIEGFFSYAMLKGLVNTALHNPDDYFTEDGYLKDEYDFRVLIHWDNECEPMKGYDDGLYSANKTQISSALRHAWAPGVKPNSGDTCNNNVIRLGWYVDAWNAKINNGLRSSRYVANEMTIDGDVSDWAGFDAAIGNGTLKVGKHTAVAYDKDGNVDRNMTLRGYYGSDGMYVSVDMTTNKLIYGNVENGKKPTANLFVNTSIEMTFFRDNGTTNKLSSGFKPFSVKSIAVVYGTNMSVAYAEVGGEQGIVESCWKYEITESGQYHSQVEIFIPNEALDWMKAKYDKVCQDNADKMAEIGYTPKTDYFIDPMLIANYLTSNNYGANTSNTTYGFAGENFMNATGGSSQAFGTSYGGLMDEKFTRWSALN